MTPLVMLLLATAAPAADPTAPVVSAPTTAAPSYTYTQPTYSEPAPESRPRLFSRIRNFFNRKSSPTPEQYPATTEVSGSRVWGGSMTAPKTSAAPVITSSPVISSESAAPPLLRPVPTSTAPESASPQRMPAGSPF